jgi:hypothetical protein
MRKTTWAAAAAVMTVLGLAGCSGPAEPEPNTAEEVVEEAPVMDLPSPTPTPAPTLLKWEEFPPPPEGEPVYDAQGFVTKEVGAPAGVVNNDTGEVVMQWMIRAITVDVECTSPDAVAPANGHFVRVDLQAQAYPELTAAYEQGGFTPDLFLQAWQAADADGVRVNADPITPAGFACLTPAEQIPSSVLPGQRAVGSIVLDLPITEGAVSMLVNGYDMGWTYNLPSA